MLAITTIARNAATSTTAATRSFATGSKGARGHGWYQKYRDGLGGRHLQGRNHNRNVDDLEAMNRQALDLGSIKVFLDLKEEDSTVTRIDLELAEFALPKTTKNFELLCGEKKYVNSLLFRYQKEVGFCLGDYIKNTGTSGACHPAVMNKWGCVDSEPLVMSHTAGTITMMSPGVDKVDSRFMLVTHDSPHLEGKFVPFGKMSNASLEKLLAIESKGIYTVRSKPMVEIVISDCGRVQPVDEESLSA
jgi:cyclophilin family peptidyl-prolyl cis-trans isomerase